MPSGKLITLEGIDGTGKSTQLDMLGKKLPVMFPRKTWVFTREPGGTILGTHVREALFRSVSEGGQEPSPVTQLLLMSASISHKVDEVIRPTLESGGCVVSDRYYDSAFIYQRQAGIPVETISFVSVFAAQKCSPNLTFLLDMDAEKALNRARSSKNANFYEDKPVAYFQELRRLYLDRARQCPHRFVVLNADQPAEAVHLYLVNYIAKYFSDYLEGV